MLVHGRPIATILGGVVSYKRSKVKTGGPDIVFEIIAVNANMYAVRAVLLCLRGRGSRRLPSMAPWCLLDI